MNSLVPQSEPCRITLSFVTGTFEGRLDIVYVTPGEGILATDVFQKDGMFCTCWKMIKTLEKDHVRKRTWRVTDSRNWMDR